MCDTSNQSSHDNQSNTQIQWFISMHLVPFESRTYITKILKRFILNKVYRIMSNYHWSRMYAWPNLLGREMLTVTK